MALPSAPQFRLPSEELLSPLFQSYPCRERQIRSLATLLHPDAAPCRNLVLHGAEATGKSAITEALLARLSATETSEEEHPNDITVNGETKASFTTASTTSPSSLSTPLRYAVVSSLRCVTARHLFETIVASVATALSEQGRSAAATTTKATEVSRNSRCETLAQLAVELRNLLQDPPVRDCPRSRFVLVLDAVDRQRDAPPTLLPALARLSEVIPCLTCVFIVTAPPSAGAPRTPSSAHLHFPPYSKQDLVRILSLSPPRSRLPDPDLGSAADSDMMTSGVDAISASATSDLWPRFCAAVHDALARPASRTLPALRSGCVALWPRFVAPVVAGTYSSKEFSKLLVAARTHFQDETLLNPSIVSVRSGSLPDATKASQSSTVTGPTKNTVSSSTTTTTFTNNNNSTSKTPIAQKASSQTDLTTLLPTTARLLLLCSYLASHNAPRHDLTLFSTYHHSRRRRRRGGATASSSRSKHRKIARKLLGAHAFVLERMLAIFAAVRPEWLDGHRLSSGAGGLDADVALAMATLASLRLLTRVGGAVGSSGGDVMDRGGKWRINVGWEVVRGVGRSVGVEVEEWLME